MRSQIKVLASHVITGQTRNVHINDGRERKVGWLRANWIIKIHYDEDKKRLTSIKCKGKRPESYRFRSISAFGRDLSWPGSNFYYNFLTWCVGDWRRRAVCTLSVDSLSLSLCAKLYRLHTVCRIELAFLIHANFLWFIHALVLIHNLWYLIILCEKRKKYLFIFVGVVKINISATSIGVARKKNENTRISHDSLNTRLVFQAHELKIAAHVVVDDGDDDDSVNGTRRISFLRGRAGSFLINLPEIALFRFMIMSEWASNKVGCVIVFSFVWINDGCGLSVLIMEK